MQEQTSHIDIDYVARLARLALTDQERVLFREQIGGILGHFERLRALDVADVEPMAHAFPLYNVWSEDVPTAPLSPEEALQNAPESLDHQVVVPRVVE